LDETGQRCRAAERVVYHAPPMRRAVGYLMEAGQITQNYSIDLRPQRDRNIVIDRGIFWRLGCAGWPVVSPVQAPLCRFEPDSIGGKPFAVIGDRESGALHDPGATSGRFPAWRSFYTMSQIFSRP